jgi:hypothetical protein
MKTLESVQEKKIMLKKIFEIETMKILCVYLSLFYIQRKLRPIFNVTLESFLCSLSTEISVSKLIEPRLYSVGNSGVHCV